MRTQSLFSAFLALLLALSLLATGAQAQEGTSDNGSPEAPALDPLDIRQGGGLPTAPPSGPGGPSAPTGVLTSGNPPLTQRTVDNVAGFIMWLLDAPLTQSQRQDLQDTVVDTWQGNVASGISTVEQMADAYSKLAQLTDTQRLQLRDQLQPQVLGQARQQGDDFSRWMLDIYAAAHQPIAPGTPPLTRQMSDANAEVTYFVLQAVATGDANMDGLQLQEGDFDQWAASLSRDYPTYTPEQQQAMARMPLFRAAMAEGWKQFSADQRAQYRNAWRPIAQQWLASVSDTSFASLFDANLVERTPDNSNRYAAVAGVSHASDTSGPSQGTTVGSQVAYERAMAQLQASHSTYMMLSGGMMSSWASNMNAINNIGNSPYTYVVK